MDSEIDIETVTGDVEAVERHARANIEALRDELTRNLRTRLAGIGWQGGIRVRADPHGGEYEPGYRAYVISTDAWYDQNVDMPGVPLEVVRAAPEEGPWAPLLEGEGYRIRPQCSGLQAGGEADCPAERGRESRITPGDPASARLRPGGFAARCTAAGR